MQAKYWERWTRLESIPSKTVPVDHGLIVRTSWPGYTVDSLPAYVEGAAFQPYWTGTCQVLALTRRDATPSGAPQPVLEIFVAVKPVQSPLSRLNEVISAWVDLQRSWMRATQAKPDVEVIEGDIEAVQAYLRGEPVSPPATLGAKIPWAAVGVGVGALLVTVVAGPWAGLAAGVLGAGAAGISYVESLVKGSPAQRSEATRNLLPYLVGGAAGILAGILVARRRG